MKGAGLNRQIRDNHFIDSRDEFNYNGENQNDSDKKIQKPLKANNVLCH